MRSPNQALGPPQKHSGGSGRSIGGEAEDLCNNPITSKGSMEYVSVYEARSKRKSSYRANSTAKLDEPRCLVRHS